MKTPRRARSAQASPKSALRPEGRACAPALPSGRSTLCPGASELRVRVPLRAIVFTYVFRNPRRVIGSSIRRLASRAGRFERFELAGLGTPRVVVGWDRGRIDVSRTKMTRTHHFEALCKLLCTVRGARRRGSTREICAAHDAKIVAAGRPLLAGGKEQRPGQHRVAGLYRGRRIDTHVRECVRPFVNPGASTSPC